MMRIMSVARWTLPVWLWLPVVAVGIAACGQDQEAADTPPQAELNLLFLTAARAGLPPTGITAADLPDRGSSGAKAVVKYCTYCHALPSPQTHSVTDWPGVVRRMWIRTDRVADEFGVPAPNSGERTVILRYLVDNALRVSAAGLPDLAGKDLFMVTCGRCHDLPDPKQHSGPDWVAVVDRMSGHMQEILDEMPKRDDLQRIMFYLEQVSQSGG
jgi:cytochrome c2